MPGIFHQPISRKSFLRISASAVGALGAARVSHLLGQTGNDALQASAQSGIQNESVRFALLSDTHIPADAGNEYRGFHPVKNLQEVVPQVQACSPDGTIVNGDAARLSGRLEDYQVLKTLLQPLAAQHPVYIGLGNHDDRNNYSRVFEQSPSARQPVEKKNVLVVDTAPVRMILLDSLLYVDRVAGLLGKAQRDWLRGYLRTTSSKATVLFVHHTLGDGDTDLLDVDRLFRILRPHSFVKAIFYGHSHCFAVDSQDGLQLINLPAVGYNFDAEQPVGWIDALFTADGVDMTLHAIGGNRQGDGKTTRVRWSLS